MPPVQEVQILSLGGQEARRLSWNVSLLLEIVWVLSSFKFLMKWAVWVIGGMSSRLCGEWAVGYVVVAHVILVSDPVPIGLWIFDCLGLGIMIGSRGTGLGTVAWQKLTALDKLVLDRRSDRQTLWRLESYRTQKDEDHWRLLETLLFFTLVSYKPPPNTYSELMCLSDQAS